HFTMIAVGDVMTDRNVGKAIAANGMDSILAKVRDLTEAADVSFCNLESPLSSVGPHDPANCSFRARPETVGVLLDGGFDIVTLANNHSLNAGREGILQTLDVLDKNHIQYCGAWRDKAKIGEPTYREVGEGPVKLAFIGMTDLSFGHGSYNKVAADRANLVAQIKDAKRHSDLVVVSFHWGDEYMPLPNQRQRNTAHAAISAGADLVLGHHPHTLEGIEVYRGRPILYSMGNFVFDQKEGERMESAIFQIEYSRGWGWQIMAKPVWIPRTRMGPIFPEVARRDRILARLQKISKPLGTTLRIKGGKAWLRVAEQ
ncbi:MAG: CapA family protein, partial [Armatimonadota bacterium]